MRVMKIILPISVVAFETDFFGVVSNTRYVEYMERGRYALMAAMSLRVTDIWREYKVQPVVRRAQIEYLSFASHEDKLELDVEMGTIRLASFEVHFVLRRPSDGAIVMRATQVLAFINERLRASRVPGWFLEAIAHASLGRANP